MRVIHPEPVQPCKAVNKLLKVKTSLRAGGEFLNTVKNKLNKPARDQKYLGSPVERC